MDDVFDYTTRGGVRVTRSIRSAKPEATRELLEALDHRRGLLLASSYEYPGRYKRYDVGSVDPVLAIEARGREVTLTALQPRGALLLAVCERALLQSGVLDEVRRSASTLSGRVQKTEQPFSEETRTRAATSFSVLRVLCELFHSEADPVLGLYGVFGYDLVFQLEALTQRMPRGERRDAVLYLPDALLVIDHERASALHYSTTSR